MNRLLLLLLLIAPCLVAKDPVYVVLWFDTEDYVDPIADDAALRIASDLTSLDVQATFKIVGEKARVLEQRKRVDVIRALARHNIGYHSNFHSIQPAPAVYLRHLGLLEGIEEFQRREQSGVLDLKRIFGVTPICYGQPGSSWGPQAHSALRKMGIPIYLDEGIQVGINDQPFWYGGLLNIYNMGRNLVRPDLDHEANNKQIYGSFREDVERLSANGGGVISTYFHPTEFVTSEFWDAANFTQGSSRERSQWVNPAHRKPEEAERCFRILKEYVEQAKQQPNVRFVTAQGLLQLYRSPIPAKVDTAVAGRFLKDHITFLETGDIELSAADLLIQVLGMPPQIVDGPADRGKTTYQSETIPAWLFDQAKTDTIGYIKAHQRLPSEVFLGSETLSLADFAATAAGRAVSSDGPVRVLRGNIEFERYFSNDPAAAFKWSIHPKGFAAPELLELAKLQGWTLKPARFK